MKKTQIVLFTCLLVQMASAVTIHVSPDGNDAAAGTGWAEAFRTLARAQAAVREAVKDGPGEPMTVLLAAGQYPLEGPLVFEPEDSGTAACPVTWTAAPGAKAVLTGGRRIVGWRPGDGGVWTAQIPEVESGQWNFIQLYVNGELRRRARIPNEGFLRVAGFPDGGRDVHYHTDCRRFEYAPGDIDPNWTNLNDVEVIVYHFWTDSHLPIESIDVDQRIVTFKHKAGKVFTDDFTADGARYIVENVYEGLDVPGEWYLDRRSGTLSYLPMPGEDMAVAEVIAPVAPALIEISGDPLGRRLVEHLRFENLELCHTSFQLPPGNSNDGQGSSSVPAAIRLRGARHCVFDACTIRDLGTFAFELSEGCQANRFTQNRLTGLAAGAFRVSGADENGHPLLRTGGSLIADNTIGPYGVVYPSAVGVLLMHTAGNRVEHNEIRHGGYTGVSVGWRWGYQRSISRDNLVAFNHIHHIGRGLLSDMGGIYTLGVSPGTVLRGNLIHDVESHHYGGWGIYNDEGSSHILVEDNVVYNTKFAGYNIHYAKEITVRNNIFAFGRLAQLSRSRVEPHKSCFFENNIVYFKEGTLLAGNWNDEPYEFHLRNNALKEKMTSTFEADWNLYFNPDKKLDEVDFAGVAFEAWQQRGKDRRSRWADPGFVDAAAFDFRLKPDSPALELGFKPIDMSTVGPRPREAK